MGGGGGSLVGTWTGFDLCVGLRLIDLTLLVLTVWRLLYGVRAVILRLGGFRQYLWGADRRAFFSVDSPGS